MERYRKMVGEDPERAKTSKKKAAGSRKGKQFIKNTEKAEYKKGTYHKK